MDHATFLRFNRKVARGNSGDCWLWTASLDRDGYGWFRSDKVTRAHRASFEYYNGPIADGLTVDHVCRNRACVNPDHLALVSRGENVLRGVGPTAVNARKTRCKNGHEFTAENTYRDRRGQRTCKACRRDTARASYDQSRRARGS